MSSEEEIEMMETVDCNKNLKERGGERRQGSWKGFRLPVTKHTFLFLGFCAEKAVKGNAPMTHLEMRRRRSEEERRLVQRTRDLEASGRVR